MLRACGFVHGPLSAHWPLLTEILGPKGEADSQHVDFCAVVAASLGVNEKVNDREEAIQTEVPIRESFRLDSHISPSSA